MIRRYFSGIFAIWENMVLAFQTIQDRKFRSFLTVMGVSIGVIIIIGVASVLNGFRQRIIDSTEQWGTTNIYLTRWPLLQMGRPDYRMRRRKRFQLTDAWAIRDECSAVMAVSPEVRNSATSVKAGVKEMTSGQIRGVFPEARDVLTLPMSSGRFFTSEENKRAIKVCVVGYTLVESLFDNKDPVGKMITVNGVRLRVIGALEKFKTPAFGGQNEDDASIFMPYYVFKGMYPWDWGMGITVRAYTGHMREALDQVEELMRRRRHVSWFSPNDFEINTSQTITETFDKITFATLAVMFALSTVAFMVGGVGVMNVMLASVKERTREIGVRRAIGARRRDIVWQFLTEAMAMTGMGGFVGVLLGEGMMYSLSNLIPSLPCTTPGWARVFGVAGSVMIGLVFGLWPAFAAAKLDPIKALRYE